MTSTALRNPLTLLRGMFSAAIDAASPMLLVPRFLPSPPKGRTIVVGAGKASAEMARALESAWNGSIKGLVVTRDGHGAQCRNIEIVEASHPVPDARGAVASRRILELVGNLTEDDLVIALISGGGSALLSAPAPGLTLDDKRVINKALLRSGAAISEMNVVRKHLSSIKGGRLAAAAFPARVVTLVISDVPGDDLSVIASGPTVPDSSTFAEARAILNRYGITEPAAALAHLERAAEESPKPGDERLTRAECKLIATPQTSLEAAATVARRAGVVPVILGDAIEGEAREVARVMAGIARQVRRHGQPAKAPAVLISGGETTVSVKGDGRGGRNVEYLLALCIALDGAPGMWAVAGDTDGVDGAEAVAGALVSPETLSRATALGLEPRASLNRNDAHAFFERLGDQVITGPTRTNVNDFRALLIV